MKDTEWTKILNWPGYRVYRHEIDAKAETLKLWVRRKRGNRVIICSGCGRRCSGLHEVVERQVRDLPWGTYQTTVMVELYRVRCPDCGPKIEKVEPVAGKAPFSKRFEDAVGRACESAAARRVAKDFGLPESTVRAIDLRYLERWNQTRRKPALKQMGVDELFLGKRQKFWTVVSNLETGEPVWMGAERKQETLDEFFRTELSRGKRSRIAAVCVDMWAAFANSVRKWAPRSVIVYDRFHVMQHANHAVDEVRRAEFFRRGGKQRAVVKGKRWLLLTRWINLTAAKRQMLNELFSLNRRLMKSYLVKESLEQLWQQPNETAARAYLWGWIDQLRWQRLPAFQKFAKLLVTHMDGLLNYYKVKVRFGVVEAINGNLRLLLRRGRGYKNVRYLLLKAQRLAATKTEFIAMKKAA